MHGELLEVGHGVGERMIVIVSNLFILLWSLWTKLRVGVSLTHNTGCPFSLERAKWSVGVGKA